jgi:RNA-directed DNA polymerase
LGVPRVLDRFVQQLVLGELQPLYEPTFSQHSWGFRPGRGAHNAVKSAQRILTEEAKSWVVDMDIKGFFDNVDHDILMRIIGLQVRDKHVLKLIGRMLRAGVWEEGRVRKPTGKGTPQGGPLSPLLANIYLDVLDKELERRGLSFSRYADDCNIYVGSEKAAQRVLGSITKFVAQRLKLEVSASKSGVDRPWKRKFHPYASTLWIPMLRGPAPLTQLRLNRRMRANRLSGGVGGVAGNSRHPDPIGVMGSRTLPASCR